MAMTDVDVNKLLDAKVKVSSLSEHVCRRAAGLCKTRPVWLLDAALSTSMYHVDLMAIN